MSEEEEEISEPIRSARSTLPGGLVSRVIEYFPPEGHMTTARDCTYEGQAFSKGATVTMVDKKIYECSGDRKGTWKEKKS